MNRFLLLFGILLCVSCAQQVAPTGGPKDETPPVVLGETPANLSTNFVGNQIKIDFDEFIQLRSTSEQVLISPPVQRLPVFQLKKKSLILKFEEELKPNTTYTINFGEAIRDNNEGNILANYTYVFSTGPHLDSMEVKGNLTDVITGLPEENALVMLYKNNIDSLPLDTTPDYFARTDENGYYHIKNVADKPFKIFALQDENANYKFDVLSEKIGFLDSLIIPFHIPKPTVPDTLASDSTTTEMDTEVVDTASIEKAPASEVFYPSYDLTMFVEEDTTQFLKKSYCDYFGKLVFVYNQPVENFQIETQNISFKKQWMLEDFSATSDTVTVWAIEAVPDTMQLLVSTNDLEPDTVELVMKPFSETVPSNKKSGGRKGGLGKTEEKFALTAVSTLRKNTAPKPNMPFSIVWNHPILGMDISRLKLYEDSVRVMYDITTEDKALRQFDIAYPWKAKKKYRLLVVDSAFTDLYQLWNDTLELSFTGTDADMYGSISLKIIETPSKPVIVDIQNSGGKTVLYRSVSTKGIEKFKLLEPGQYSIIVVDDLNGNGKWDSGRYSQKLQHEPIRTIQKDSEVRANWDLELEWNPNGQSPAD